MGIEAINPFELPLLNTVILLSSGATVTYAHHSLIQGNRSGALLGLLATVFLAVIFTCFQGIEYSVSSFTISDGIFGSSFYFGTGFHGLHVMIGSKENVGLLLCESSLWSKTRGTLRSKGKSGIGGDDGCRSVNKRSLATVSSNDRKSEKF